MSTPAEDGGLLLSGRYRLESRLADGGAGSVWRAFDTLLARPVAVKLLHPALQEDPTTRRRFHREATVAAAIHHPHAAVVYDVGEDDGRAYLVMELVDGPSLADVLDGTPLPVETVVSVGQQVAAALGAAHERGITHRDVKPGNILLSPAGAAKVVDFGIAKALGETTQRLTAAGTVLGTAAYVAPEQLEADRVVDGRADVYSLGLVLHRCLTGRDPFDGDTRTETAAQRLLADVPPPRRFRPELDGEIDELVVRATRLDPEERFPDGRALAQALLPHLPEHPAPLLRELAEHRPDELQRTQVLRTGEYAAHSTTRLLGAGGTRPHEHVGPATDAGSGTDAVATGPDREPEHTPRTETLAPPLAEVLPEEPAPPRVAPSTRRAIWAGVGLVLAALLGLLLLAGGGDGGRAPSGDTAGGDAPAQPHRIAGGTDFDPYGGDGEHPEDVPGAFDGDPSTAWTTQRYSNPEFGNLKPGVGISFDLGDVVEVRRAELLLATAGIDFQIYASPEPFRGPEDLRTPVATVADAGAEPSVDVGGASGRYWLIWITRVPAGRAQIAEVEFDR